MVVFFRKAASRIIYKLRLANTIKSDLGILIGQLPIRGRRSLHDTIMMQLEATGKPFNKHDYVAIGLFALALRCKDVEIYGINGETKLNLTFLHYVKRHLGEVNSKTRATFDLIHPMYKGYLNEF